jgi:hypothetical protein
MDAKAAGKRAAGGEDVTSLQKLKIPELKAPNKWVGF